MGRIDGFYIARTASNIKYMDLFHYTPLKELKFFSYCFECVQINFFQYYALLYIFQKRERLLARQPIKQ